MPTLVLPDFAASLPFEAEIIRFIGPERDRTADLLLAKQALSQLSYRPSKRVEWLTCIKYQRSPKSWAQVGSNHRPYAYQAYALTS